MDEVVGHIHSLLSADVRKAGTRCLTYPNISHTRDLYLINSDFSLLRNCIVPITSVANSLRAHSSGGFDGQGVAATKI